MHGPAINMIPTEFDGTTGNEDIRSVDYAPAYKHTEWPATEWATRPRPSRWPSKNLVESITRDGCHVVSKAHPSSSEAQAEIEFRFSFSVAENQLCETITEVHRQCYALFKMLVVQTSKETEEGTAKPKLTSYYLKTVLFWVNEELPQASWTRDNLGICLLALLNELLGFLHDGNIPITSYVRTT